MQTRKQWFGYVGALTYTALMGFSGMAAAATEPHSIAINYVPGERAAQATISWQSDSPRAYGFDVNRREAGTTTWTRVRYASEPIRSVVDTNLKPLTRYEYQVISYRPGIPATGHPSAVGAGVARGFRSAIGYPSNIVSTTLDFPYNVPYPNGIIPTNYTQAQKNTHAQTMYNAWKARYLTADGAGANGLRVYKPLPLETSEETVSEGQGYGMVIVALMATSTNGGRADFDKLVNYYKSKTKSRSGMGNIGLMAWRINKDGSVADPFVAPDGDLDAAYSLLVADKKWGSAGTINYKAEALTIINALMRWTVFNNNATPSLNSHLIFRSDMAETTVESATHYTMSSYQMVQYFRQFRDATNDARWDDVRRAGYKFYEYFYNNSKTAGGTTLALTPFVFLTRPGVTQYGPSTDRGYHYGLDSGRTPWRVGMDYLWYGNTNVAQFGPVGGNPTLVRDMPAANTRFLMSVTGNNLTAIDLTNFISRYDIDGTPSGTTKWDFRALIAPMAVAAMTDSSNQVWLNTLYEWIRTQVPGVSGGTGNNAGYYPDTVMMMCMLALTGNAPNLPDVILKP